MTRTKTALKSAVLPRGRATRRLPTGIGRGLRLGIDFHEGQTGLYLGLYEIELNRHLKSIARPGYRSFDVGGQVGYDALVLAKLTGAAVVSVECDPDLVEEIERNATANPGLDVTAVRGFVADTGDDGRVTIDGLADRFFVPDLIKLDIEGGEVDALRGADRVLTERRPAILLEVHAADLEWESLERLRAAGYGPPTVVDRRRWLPDRRPLPHNRWLVFAG
jgi:hypothetical protein